MQALRIEHTTTPADLHRWDAFVLGHPEGSVFHRPQWLQHTSTWPVQLLLASYDHELLGGFAFVVNARHPLRRIMPPVLTSRFGPLVRPDIAPALRQTIYTHLLGGLPRHDLIHLSSITTDASVALVSALTSFRRYETPTHIKAPITPITDETALIASYASQIRRQLPKALEAGAQPIPQAEPSQAYALFRQAYATRGQRPRFTEHWFCKHFTALHADGMATLPGIVDASGRLVGALLLAEDTRTTYYIVSGIDREALNGHAGAFLIHSAIAYASNSGKFFDFNGSSIPGINTFFEKFQGKPASVMHLKKALTGRGSLALQLAILFKKPII